MPKDLILKKVGSRIRACRIKAGLNQEEVENYGVSWKHYQKIEAGQTNTTVKILYKLAKAFKCHPREFLA
jgi:transcriptional regulator with XRE-family HTH domain